jgi:hypothetical protein
MSDVTDSNLRRTRRESVEEDIHSRIGTKLKSYYDDVLSQPVPERFTELLRRLDEQADQAEGKR